MNRIHKTALALMLAGTSIAASAQTAPPPPPPEAKTQAMAYVMASGMSDMFEINSSQIAVQKSKTPAVRNFANMMIKHHTKTTADTMKAAKKAGLNPPPPMLDPGANASLAELNAASPDDFDRVYLAQQVPAHQAALDLQTSYATQGDQAALRTNARKATPIVRSHLNMAEKMQSGGAHKGHSGM